MDYLGSISLLPKSNRNVVPKKFDFSNYHHFSTKLQKLLFEAQLVLNSSVKQFNFSNAFEKGQEFKLRIEQNS